MPNVRKRTTAGAAPYLDAGEEVQVGFPDKANGKFVVVVGETPPESPGGWAAFSMVTGHQQPDPSGGTPRPGIEPGAIS